MSISKTPKPPYYDVIFTSQHTKKEWDEYEETSPKMVALAQKMPGFLGVESARDEKRFGITSAYWKDIESIEVWQDHTEHKKAKKRGRGIWFENIFYALRK